MSEIWIICAECFMHVREEESKDGLCFWCTPEGKKKIEEIEERNKQRVSV